LAVAALAAARQDGNMIIRPPNIEDLVRKTDIAMRALATFLFRVWERVNLYVDESDHYTSATVGGNVGTIDVTFTSRVAGKPLVKFGIEGDNRVYVESYTSSNDVYSAMRLRTKNAAGAFTDAIVVHVVIHRKPERS
jgi:hypothetical protein